MSQSLWEALTKKIPAIKRGQKSLKYRKPAVRDLLTAGVVRVFIRDLIKTVHPALRTHIQNEIRTFDFRCFPI
jgi:hypothetical protein